ncbi:MAG TPA: GntR family transcriptional regulator [Clostridia bacterium]|nr:GntR family transcriptional regulator [Clostridia bacterium]
MAYSEQNELNKYSLTGRVFKQLSDQILNGEYKPGESLVETKLAKELGVSRTPIREALRQLELEGLVVSIPNKGVFVRGISEQDIEDIYAIRFLVEGLAARWAAEKITEEELNELKETVDLMEFYISKGDMDRVFELDTKFHDLIYSASKSRPLCFVLGSLHNFVQRARVGSVKVPGRADKTLIEHRSIVQAFENRDPDAAEKALTNHVLSAKANWLKNKDKLGKGLFPD